MSQFGIWSTKFNMDINNIHSRYTAEDIEFDNLDFSIVRDILSGVLEAYEGMQGCSAAISALGIESFSGEAAEAIQELLIALPKYLNDFEHTVSDLVSLVNASQEFVESLPESNLLKEISSI